MSSRIASSIARLLTEPRTLSASMFLTYRRSKAAGIGRTSRRASEICSTCLPASSTPARCGGDVGVVREGVPRAEDEVVQRSDRDELADQRRAVIGALAEADRAHQCKRPDRRRHPALDQFDAGDERRRHGAETDRQHAESSLGRRHRRRRRWVHDRRIYDALDAAADAPGGAGVPNRVFTLCNDATWPSSVPPIACC